MAAAADSILKPTDHELVITRTFDAPRPLVWQAWTKQEHLFRWSCPDEYTMLLAEGDLRIGGKWRVIMRAPDGVEHIMSGAYREIDEPKRLVFTHWWENDEHLPLTFHETQITVELEALAEQTRMTFTQTGLATASSRDGHAEGWTQAFGHLNSLLQELSGGEAQ